MASSSSPAARASIFASSAMTDSAMLTSESLNAFVAFWMATSTSFEISIRRS